MTNPSQEGLRITASEIRVSSETYAVYTLLDMDDGDVCVVTGVSAGGPAVRRHTWQAAARVSVAILEVLTLIDLIRAVVNSGQSTDDHYQSVYPLLAVFEPLS